MASPTHPHGLSPNQNLQGLSERLDTAVPPCHHRTVMAYCPKCKHDCPEAAQFCPTCGHQLLAPAPPVVTARPVQPLVFKSPSFQPVPAPQSLPAKPPRGTTICHHCGGLMVKRRGPGSAALQLFGVVVFLFGLALCFTIVGAIIGIPLMLTSLFMGVGKKVWRCTKCRSIIPRG